MHCKVSVTVLTYLLKIIIQWIVFWKRQCTMSNMLEISEPHSSLPHSGAAPDGRNNEIQPSLFLCTPHPNGQTQKVNFLAPPCGQRSCEEGRGVAWSARQHYQIQLILAVSRAHIYPSNMWGKLFDYVFTWRERLRERES